MRSKTDSYLGLARKAGRLLTGTDTCRQAVRSGKLKLIIIAQDTAPGSLKKVKNAAESHGIPWRIFGNSDELSRITGSSGRYVFGITDAGFADVIIKEIDGNKEV